MSGSERVAEIRRELAHVDTASGRSSWQFWCHAAKTLLAALDEANAECKRLGACCDRYQLDERAHADSLMSEVRRAERAEAERAEANIKRDAWEQAWQNANQERDAANARIAEWKRAIEALTPGGSEYVDDPERCAATIQRTRDIQMSVLRKQAKQIKELEAQNAELSAALLGAVPKEDSDG